MADLLNGGYIEKVNELPVVFSPLSVVTNGVGKKRLVVNLRHVNRSLWNQKFKYEDLCVAMMMFKQGEWMFSFDLKSGYHHVDVAKCHRKYLGFEWGGSWYTFVVLPFGLSSAPYVFTSSLVAGSLYIHASCNMRLTTLCETMLSQFFKNLAASCSTCSEFHLLFLATRCRCSVTVLSTKLLCCKTIPSVQRTSLELTLRAMYMCVCERV